MGSRVGFTGGWRRSARFHWRGARFSLAVVNDTIAAISTPFGEGAIALLRLSGSCAVEIARGIFRGVKEFTPRLAHFGAIHDGGRKLDEVLLTVFPAPASYTGEDVVEIACHGGVLISRHGKYGSAFASVSGAMLTVYAAKHGVDSGAKDLLNNFFGSTAGAIAYQAIELRPPAQKNAQKAEAITEAQKGFGKAGAIAGIPQIGAILNGATGSKSYWDLLPAFWTAVLVDGKDPVSEASKLDAFFKTNIAAGIKDL